MEGLKLTNKQRKFCDEYLIDCNGTQAAIRAGYSPKTANEQAAKLMTDSRISTYISEKLDEISSERIADAQEVLEYLTSVMRGEHTEQILRLDGNGVQVLDQIQVSAKERLKAAELIGKRFGMFKDSFQIEGTPVLILNELELNDEGTVFHSDNQKNT